MAFQSAIYEGWVRHRRYQTKPHSFRYALFMPYLDLDELPHLFRGRWLWGHERAAVASFRRADYLGDSRQPLREAVADVVEERLGRRPEGPIRLLTNLRYFGYAFNPVSIYYCFEAERVSAVVLQVTNTPWGQRHAYVLDAAACSADRAIRLSEPKRFHVSPFLGMDLGYDFVMTPPGRRLIVHMDCFADSGKALDATLVMNRRPWNGASLAGSLVRFPWMTGKVIASIYWQAFRLWWKRVPYVSPPHEKVDASTP